MLRGFHTYKDKNDEGVWRGDLLEKYFVKFVYAVIEKVKLEWINKFILNYGNLEYYHMPLLCARVLYDKIITKQNLLYKNIQIQEL